MPSVFIDGARLCEVLCQRLIRIVAGCWLLAIRLMKHSHEPLGSALSLSRLCVVFVDKERWSRYGLVT